MISCNFCTFFVILISVRYCATQENYDTTYDIPKKWGPHYGPYIQQISEPIEHGKEPFWDYRTQLLYFSDYHKGLIISLDPETRDINTLQLDGYISPVIPTKTINKFIVGNNNSIITFNWNGRNSSAVQNLEILFTVDSDKTGNHFSAGKADKLGRLWWGTMGYENSSGVIQNQGSLYKISKRNNKNPSVEITPVSNSNGLSWSRDNTKLYFVDSGKVNQYDFDLNKGEISNKQIVFDVTNYSVGGVPSGMTTDKDGNLFIALMNGGEVIKVQPKTGEILQRIAIPAKRVASCMFGGKNLDILFVTTSKYGLTETEHLYEPAAGAVFAITNLGTRGNNLNIPDEF